MRLQILLGYMYTTLMNPLTECTKHKADLPFCSFYLVIQNIIFKCMSSYVLNALLHIPYQLVKYRHAKIISEDTRCSVVFVVCRFFGNAA